MTALTDLIHHFAALLDPADGNAALLSTWITSAQTEDLPHLHAFTRGLEKDRAAVDAALTLPHHNGGTEGVNSRTKLIKRQMYGRASVPARGRADSVRPLCPGHIAVVPTAQPSMADPWLDGPAPRL